MEQDIDRLLKLQEIDLEIDKLEKLLKSIPEEIKKLKEEKENLIFRFEKINNDIKHAEARKKEKELDIQTYEDRILKIQDALNRVKTNEEYKSLLREKAQIEETIMEIEDEILNIMEEIEQLKKEREELEKKIEIEKKKIEEEISKKEELLKEVQERLDSLKKERELYIKEIPPNLLSRYELIKKKRGSKVIAIVEDDTCTGCYMIIPPKVYSSLVKGEQLLNCPHCGRFLYYKPV
jgi:predicted  nucleic acid-binding Zn-ribbon protein